MSSLSSLTSHASGGHSHAHAASCSPCSPPAGVMGSGQIVNVMTVSGDIVQVYSAVLPIPPPPDKNLVLAQRIAIAILALLSFKEDPKTSLIALAVGLAMGANAERLGFVKDFVSFMGGCGGNLDSHLQHHVPWQYAIVYSFLNRWNHLDHGPIETFLAPCGVGVMVADLFRSYFYGNAGKN